MPIFWWGAASPAKALRTKLHSRHSSNWRKPSFALVLVDIAWEMLLKSHPGSEISAVQDILGQEVPIAGGYTLGQIVPARESKMPQLLNQHIVVVAFAEA